MLRPETHRRVGVLIIWVLLMAALAGGAWWLRDHRSDPAVTALAALTDPEKLATLRTKRAANPRVLKCIYWLHDAQIRGHAPEDILTRAQAMNDKTEAHARLVKLALLRNLDIAEKLGCLTSDNLARMKRGRAPTITRGPYAGEQAEIDHIVPVSRTPELDKELANLEIMPASVNRRKGAKVGARQIDYLNRFVEAGIISAQAAAKARRVAN